ncbi:MAG: hypothetical protein ACE5D1_06755 [Fidelibacterota bacterium]
MEKNNTIDEILVKVQEIQGFFKVGDELIPFLTELFLFLKETIPLMAKVDQSILESANKLPTASEKIQSASQTAESATHKILDKLDTMSEELISLEQRVGKEDRELIRKIQSDVQESIYVLQFQDITSQQLEHAIRILNVIKENFDLLFTANNKMKLKTTIAGQVLGEEKKTELQETLEEESQEFQDQTKDIIREGTFSQDDIDKLFPGKK